MIDLNNKDPKTYEVGYLLVPFVADAEKDNTVKKELVAVIEKNGGQVISELSPLVRRLAYSIRKMINNKYSVFNEAFFGAIKFEATPDAIEAMNLVWRKSDMIVRHLLIEAPKGAYTKIKPVVPFVPATEVESEPEVAPVVAKAETDEVAIDKEIDDLLVS
ncbi:MAG: small subunit ribosomal protein [Patescibacteria group bacterium]|nr:small subunit ribosomal protein [Patescibacteria group bacterium]